MYTATSSAAAAAVAVPPQGALSTHIHLGDINVGEESEHQKQMREKKEQNKRSKALNERSKAFLLTAKYQAKRKLSVGSSFDSYHSEFSSCRAVEWNHAQQLKFILLDGDHKPILTNECPAQNQDRMNEESSLNMQFKFIEATLVSNCESDKDHTRKSPGYTVIC